MRIIRTLTAAVILVITLTWAVSAQTTAPSNQTAATTQLKLQIVLTEMEGTKKLSALPYTIRVIPATPAIVSQFRMGVRVPISVKGDETQYVDIGTNIDTSAKALDNGRFQLHFAVERSSVPSINLNERTTTDTKPLVRTLRLTCDVILRDGQTLQVASATDPIGGNSLLMDVTINVER